MPQQAENMLEKIKNALRKSHPKWDAKRISSTAYAIVTSHYTSEGKSVPFN